MRTCLTCGGTYEPIGADGVRYFHACPPLSVRELEAALAAGTLPLSAVNRARLKAAQAADATTPVAADAPTRVQQLLGTLIVERPNKRDENILVPATDDAPAQIRAAGAGFVDTVLVDNPEGASAADV